MQPHVWDGPNQPSSTPRSFLPSKAPTLRWAPVIPLHPSFLPIPVKKFIKRCIAVPRVLVSCSMYVDYKLYYLLVVSGVARLGYTGARALATGGRAPPVQARIWVIGADSIVVDRESGAKRSWNWTTQYRYVYPQNSSLIRSPRTLTKHVPDLLNASALCEILQLVKKSSLPDTFDTAMHSDLSTPTMSHFIVSCLK